METKVVNTKREQIKKTAKELFWKFGIRKVSTEEICKESGVSKMTFYKHYPNKFALAVEIFEDLADDLYAWFDEMIHSDIPFEEKLKKLIFKKMEAAEKMSMEFIRDVYSADITEVREMMFELMKKNNALTETFLEIGKREGYIRKDLQNNFIQYQLNQIVTMMQDNELLSLFENSQALTKAILDYFFYGIMNPVERKI